MLFRSEAIVDSRGLAQGGRPFGPEDVAVRAQAFFTGLGPVGIARGKHARSRPGRFLAEGLLVEHGTRQSVAGEFPGDRQANDPAADDQTIVHENPDT